MRDLRGWLKQVEDMGELAVISRELDWDEETSALNYMVGQREGAPALLFEKIKDARRASAPCTISSGPARSASRRPSDFPTARRSPN